jgi:hypothetical protein
MIKVAVTTAWQAPNPGEILRGQDEVGQGSTCTWKKVASEEKEKGKRVRNYSNEGLDKARK